MLQRPLKTLLFLLLALPSLHAVTRDQAMAAGVAAASSTRSTRDNVVRAIPFSKMNQPTQAKLWNVVSKPSIYRQMPAEVIASDPKMFLYLVRHPEIIVNIWELMGITHVKMDRTGDYTFAASDGAGTNSNVELVYGTNNLHVLYAEGTYEGPLFKRPIRGQCVMVLRSDYSQDQSRRTMVSNQFDIFLKVDHLGAELIAKTLHPLVGRAADYNFSESIKFIGKVAEAAERNGPGVQRLTSQLTKVKPEMRQEFSDPAALGYHNSVLRKSGEFQPGEAQSAESQATEFRPASSSLTPTLQKGPARAQPSSRDRTLEQSLRR